MKIITHLNVDQNLIFKITSTLRNFTGIGSFLHRIISNNRNSSNRGLNLSFSIFYFRTELDFELVCNETLESLCDCLERIIEENPDLDNPDITFSVCI